MTSEAWITGGAGLLGALLGGVAVLIGARMEAATARRLAREQRTEDMVAELLRELWDVMALRRADPDEPTEDVLLDTAVLQRASRLSALAQDREPALSRVAHDYGNGFHLGAPIHVTRLRSAALSSALDLWQRRPKEFRRRNWDLAAYEAGLAQSFADREMASEVEEEASPSD